MTPNERALLLDLHRWARAAGWIQTGWPGNPIWRGPRAADPVFFVAVQRSLPGVAVRRRGTTPYAEYRCRTITEAVDILAALRVIPARYSSTYRAGWYAGAAGHLTPLTDDQYRAAVPAGLSA